MGEGAGNCSDQQKSQFFMVISQLVELLVRQHVQVDIGVRNGCVTAGKIIKKGQTTKKITPSVGGDVVQLSTAADGRHDASSTPADQVKIAIVIAKGVDEFTGLERTLLQARLQVGQGRIFAALKQVHLLQLQKDFFIGRFSDVAHQSVFYPFNGRLNGRENA